MVDPCAAATLPVGRVGVAPDPRHVTILLGTRDGAAHLGTQLASIARQSHQNWSLRISDDGSRDRTLDLIGRFQSCMQDHAITCAPGPRRGAAANYLSMIAGDLPAGGFVALSDQDDLWFPNRLRRGVARLAAVPAHIPALYAAQTRPTDVGLVPLPPAKHTLPRPSFANALVQNVMAGNTMMMNRAAWQILVRAPRNPAPPFHDWWIYAVLAGIGAKLILDPAPVLAYRQHPGNLMGAHRGVAARATRLARIACGDWRRWLMAHHASLAAAAHLFLPEHRAALSALKIEGRAQRGLARMRSYAVAGAERQTRGETTALRLAALAGLA